MKPAEAEIDALAARQAQLEAELADARRERDEVARMIEERRRLPVLPNIRMANPCPADWNAMRGDDRVRACATCKKNVYNLSAMTRADAEALLVEKHGDLCAQYYQRADGTILLSDCTIQLTRRRTTLAVVAAATAIAGTALAVHATQVPAKRAPHVVPVELRRVPSVPSYAVEPSQPLTAPQVVIQPMPTIQPAPRVEQELEPQMQMKRGGIRIHHDPDLTR